MNRRNHNPNHIPDRFQSIYSPTLRNPLQSNPMEYREQWNDRLSTTANIGISKYRPIHHPSTTATGPILTELIDLNSAYPIESPSAAALDKLKQAHNRQELLRLKQLQLQHSVHYQTAVNYPYQSSQQHYQSQLQSQQSYTNYPIQGYTQQPQPQQQPQCQPPQSQSMGYSPLYSSTEQFYSQLVASTPLQLLQQQQQQPPITMNRPIRAQTAHPQSRTTIQRPNTSNRTTRIRTQRGSNLRAASLIGTDTYIADSNNNNKSHNKYSITSNNNNALSNLPSISIYSPYSELLQLTATIDNRVNNLNQLQSNAQLALKQYELNRSELTKLRQSEWSAVSAEQLQRQKLNSIEKNKSIELEKSRNNIQIPVNNIKIQMESELINRAESINQLINNTNQKLNNANTSINQSRSIAEHTEKQILQATEGLNQNKPFNPIPNLPPPAATAPAAVTELSTESPLLTNTHTYSNNNTATESESESEPVICELCDDNPAVYYCDSCTLNLCDSNCDSEFHRPANKQQHNRVKIKSQQKISINTTAEDNSNNNIKILTTEASNVSSPVLAGNSSNNNNNSNISPQSAQQLLKAKLGMKKITADEANKLHQRKEMPDAAVGGQTENSNISPSPQLSPKQPPKSNNKAKANRNSLSPGQRTPGKPAVGSKSPSTRAVNKSSSSAAGSRVTSRKNSIVAPLAI